MPLVDFTHPGRIPGLKLEHDHRHADYYLRLDELPPSHPYHSLNWALFRYPDWLEGGSAWLQAWQMSKVLESLSATIEDELRPVVGSGDPGFDEALAQSLRTLGYRPFVAERTSLQ